MLYSPQTGLQEVVDCAQSSSSSTLHWHHCFWHGHLRNSHFTKHFLIVVGSVVVKALCY
jgi:hypothetical protein